MRSARPLQTSVPRGVPVRCSSYLRLVVFVACCGALVLADRATQACTAFCAAVGDRVLVGNNEDWNNPRTRLWFVPAAPGALGRMYVGFDDLTPQGGMNERGLWFDGFAAPPVKVEPSDLPRYPGNLVEKAMSECGTVEEVARLFSQYDRSFLSQAILMFADATGDAASIEANAIVRKSRSHFVQTNFHQSRGPYGGGVDRYTTATSMLDAAGGAISVDLFTRILDATHQYGFSPTLYSNIYDLRARTMVLYYFHDFEHPVRIDLLEELKKGKRILEIPALFPTNAKADAFAASRGAARRSDAGGGLSEGSFVLMLAAVALGAVTLAVFGWVRGGREIRIVLLAGVVVLVLTGGVTVGVLHFHRQALPQWDEFRIGPSAGQNASIGTSVVRADGLTLRQALATAYEMPAVRIAGPTWIDDVRYSIDASVPPEASATFRALLREELQGRLNLRTHIERRPFDVYVLGAGPSPRLERASGQSLAVWVRETDAQMQDGSMKDLANLVQGILRTPVVDETHLEGAYNVAFGWTEDRLESVTAAIEGKFGLRLTPARRELETLVIDEIRREPALVLLDHVGRLTRAAPPSVRQKVARFLSLQ